MTDINQTVSITDINVYTVNSEGNNLMHHAVDSNNLKLVQELCNQFYDFDVSNDLGMYPIHMAVCNRNIEMVQLLYNQGVRMTVEDCKGRTPLHYAARNGDDNMIRWLISHGIPSSPYDDNDRNPLFDAIDSESVPSVSYLASVILPALKEKRKIDPLRYACMKELIPIVKVMLPFYHPEIVWKSVLPYAVNHSKLKLIEFLLTPKSNLTRDRLATIRSLKENCHDDEVVSTLNRYI